MQDCAPDFQGRSHLWTGFCRRFSEGIFVYISAMERSFRARVGASGPCTCRLSVKDAGTRLPCWMANLIFREGLISGHDGVDASLRVLFVYISATERSFRARVDASGPSTCHLSGEDARRWLPCWMANLNFKEGLISGRHAADASLRVFCFATARRRSGPFGRELVCRDSAHAGCHARMQAEGCHAGWRT